MKTLLKTIVLTALCLAGHSQAGVLFEDGFETGSLGDKWTRSDTNDGRVAVNGKYKPATGRGALVLDDRVNDSVSSVAEATLKLDLSHKGNVILNFKAKSLGNEPDEPSQEGFVRGRDYDGVAISVDGGKKWHVVQSLASVGSKWQSFSISLGSIVSLNGTAVSFGRECRFRFSEFGNASAPLDGIEIDDVSVTGDDEQSVEFEVPARIVEGKEPQTGHVLLSFAPKQPLTLKLASDPPGLISAPDVVVVPAGKTSAEFLLSATNDRLANGIRTAVFRTELGWGYYQSTQIRVVDDDLPIAKLKLPPLLFEGGSPTANARISIKSAVAVDTRFALRADPDGEVKLPSHIVIPAGQTSAKLTIRARNDEDIDGNVTVAVTASSGGTDLVTAQTMTVDNEVRELSLVMSSIIAEGGTDFATVSLSGILKKPISISIRSDTPGTLTFSKTVTIPAGQREAVFPITAVENALRDGSRKATVSVTAKNFTGAKAGTIIRDNEVAGYSIGISGSFVNASEPLPISVSAIDVEGNVIDNVSRKVKLSAVLADGSTMPLTPAEVTIPGEPDFFGNNVWSGDVTLPPTSSPIIRLRASDSKGNSGDSDVFDVMRELGLTTADLLWDAARGRIIASVPAGAPSHANQVVAIDPATMQITGSVTTNQDPGQIVITSGGEYLYVAINGNGTIAKINPATMTVISTFAVGTDFYQGTLYAADMCAVAGQPELLVVSRSSSVTYGNTVGVVAYDNGVMRPDKPAYYSETDVIEPSADPTIFFGYHNQSTEFGFRRLKLGPTGMSELSVDRNLVEGFYTDIRSAGDKVFSTSGVAVDGAKSKRLGIFSTNGPVAPDLASNRVFYLENDTGGGDGHFISSYDPTTFSLIRRVALQNTTGNVGSLIRWGANGLAFRTETSVVVLVSPSLVQSDPPADLAITVQATPNPATVGAAITYTVQATNLGSRIAHNSLLDARFSDSQTLQTITASVGILRKISELEVSLSLGDLAPGATATLTVTAVPQSAGSLSCSASVTSNAVDLDHSNNSALRFVSVGFQSALDVVNSLRLPANNLVYDPTRNLLWASIPAMVEEPLDALLVKSVVSIDPITGLISDPIPINADSYSGSMAISANGRYLYIGLKAVPEVHRIDLATAGHPSLRIPLGLSRWGDANHAQDIEVLDGDGTSFIMAGDDDHAAAVYDGTVMRADRTGIYSVDRIERSGTAGVFIGYNNYSSGFDLTRLSVTAAGVAEIKNVSNVISGYYEEIRGDGDLLLSSTGRLIDSSTLALKANLGSEGIPCVDAVNQRAYLVSSYDLHSYDTATGNTLGSLSIPPLVFYSNKTSERRLVRWGTDGFAILGNDGSLYLTRWSLAVPAAPRARAITAISLPDTNTSDSDGDGIPNAFENLFGTSPTQFTANPLKLTAATAGNSQRVIHLNFPRRAGLAMPAYGYEISSDLATWSPTENVTETVVSTQTTEGVEIENVDAAFPAQESGSGFVRLYWLP
ncbi:MAG: hypothetical protein ABIT37_24025 [Luteolibacter sp.]